MSEPDMESLNSMLYWWPKVVKLDIPKPKTVMITIDDVVDDVFRCLLSEGEDRESCKKATEKVKAITVLLDEAVREHIGNYPVFLRSDYTSCKHYSTRNPLYRIESPDDFPSHIFALIGECHEPIPVRGFFGMPKPKALAIREWLNIVRWSDVVPGFYGNIEVRVFVERGRVVEVYPYYHKSGLIEHVLKKLDEHDKEKALREYKEKYVKAVVAGLAEIVSYARRIASVEGIREYDWSMDFALVEKNGRRTWYFIDMALAEASWRPKEKTEEDRIIEKHMP